MNLKLKSNKAKAEYLRKIEVLQRLKKLYPDAKTALIFDNPFEILVATILSAQSTDKLVNKVTGRLFKKYKAPKDYILAGTNELEQDIRSTGFFRNKARSIIGAATLIETEYAGRVPDKMEEILKLPGVARKTANVVLSEAYGVIEGIAVDTHVMRLSKRLGLSNEKSAEKIEKDLMEIYPKSDWYAACNTLIYHGREICKAKKPECNKCVLADICPSAFLFNN